MDTLAYLHRCEMILVIVILLLLLLILLEEEEEERRCCLLGGKWIVTLFLFSLRKVTLRKDWRRVSSTLSAESSKCISDQSGDL